MRIFVSGPHPAQWRPRRPEGLDELRPFSSRSGGAPAAWRHENRGTAPGVLTVVCAWCGVHYGEKDSEGAPSGFSHGMCDGCAESME